MRHGWIKLFVKNFEYNHLFQFKFHLWMMSFWMVNVAVGTVILFLWPAEWLRIGVYYVFLLSLYANWDTDYDAVSASQAALHSQQAMRGTGRTDELTKDDDA